MKKIIVLLIVLIAVVTAIVLVGCNQKFDTENYIRLHIRADSNDTEAQKVKLAVRDEIVGYLSAKSNDVSSRDEMLAFLQSELPNIEKRADTVLRQNGFDYSCNATIRREDFPEKTYGDLTLPEGNYLALILELGSGNGQNWWCVAYPPLCFVASEDAEGDTVEYRSIIADFFNKLTEKK